MGQPDVLVAVGAIAGTVLVTLLVFGVVLWRCVHVVRPDEALVVMGRRRRLADGRLVGFRVVTQGRVVGLPVLERVERLDTRTLSLALERTSVVSRDDVHALVSITATVKVARAEDDLARYVEAFLGRGREQVADTARRALEEHVRSVAGRYRAAELDPRRQKLADEVQEAASRELEKVGLLAGPVVVTGVVVDAKPAAKPAPEPPAVPVAPDAPAPPAAPAADPFAIQGALPALGPSGALGGNGGDH